MKPHKTLKKLVYEKAQSKCINTRFIVRKGLFKGYIPMRNQSIQLN